MAEKFALKYRRLIPAEPANNSSSESKERVYLHDHRIKDSVEEYLDHLEE